MSRAQDREGIPGRRFLVQVDDDFLLAADLEGEPAVVGGDGQLVAAAIHQHGELDKGRAAVVEQFGERGLTVRPEYSTSSTRMTAAPLTSWGMMVGENSLGIGCWPMSSR